MFKSAVSAGWHIGADPVKHVHCGLDIDAAPAQQLRKILPGIGEGGLRGEEPDPIAIRLEDAAHPLTEDRPNHDVRVEDKGLKRRVFGHVCAVP